MTANAKLSMESADWHTPLAIIEAARAVMGTIDVDPASSPEANEAVQATTYFTEDDDGLVEACGPDGLIMRAWYGRVFLNPPGGQVRRFWETLLLNHALGNTSEAIWVGYSLEQFQSLQNANYQQLDDAQPRHPLAFPTCIPKQRLKFVENEAKRESRKTFERIRMRRVREHAGSPTHGNYITYLGPNVDRFVEEFSVFGVVVR
jgi:ParB family chromosome partitioning protein